MTLIEGPDLLIVGMCYKNFQCRIHTSQSSKNNDFSNEMAHLITDCVQSDKLQIKLRFLDRGRSSKSAEHF